MVRGPRRVLWRLNVTAHAEAEEAVSELLSGLFGQIPVSYAPLDSRRTTLSVYLERKADWSADRRKRLSQGAKELRKCGLEPGNVRVALRRLAPADWAEAWKRHFKPIEIGRTLLIKPSWSRRLPRRGQQVIVLDPGLSFGTGQHPTTRFCLEEIARRKTPFGERSLLDIGSGSGILAIAAARLGYRPVHALDCDAEAVSIAQANARENQLSEAIQFFRRDLARLPMHSRTRYEVVCANLASDLLLRERERIMRRLAPGGLLVLAGVLRREFSELRRAYRSAGLRLCADRVEDEWHSGSFERRR